MKASTTLAAASLTVAHAAHAAGSDTIRIGIVGCGGRASGAARDAMQADPATRLVAMCDLFADRIEGKYKSLKEQMPDRVDVPKDRMFVGIDGYKGIVESVDVVLIACAAKFHPMYVKAAIDAGKHVFCEKPHGIDPLGMKVLAAACNAAKQKNLGVLSGLQSRFAPEIRETIQRIHDGQIGQVVSFEENFVRPPYGATRRTDGLRELEVQYGNQYRFSWLCGDDVPQSLVHNMDRATWALGETTPVKCHGFGGRSGPQNLLGDVFDHHAVVYKYANGMRGYAFCRTCPNCYNENSSMIVGTKGKAYPLAGRIEGEKPWKYEGERISPYVEEHRQFLKSIRDGKPLNCGDYMVRSTLVCIMGQLSCYSGKEVSWEQACQSDYCITPRPEECTGTMEPPTKPDEKGVYPVAAMPGVTVNIEPPMVVKDAKNAKKK